MKVLFLIIKAIIKRKKQQEKIHTPEEVETFLELPLLGKISKED